MTGAERSLSGAGSPGLLAGDVLHEVDAAVAVAPLVVIPAHELEELAVQLEAAAGVEDGAVRIVDEVGRDHFITGVGKDALEIRLAGLLHRGADFLVAGL